MKGINIDGAGGREVLKRRDFEDPKAGEGEVVIKVVATAINRADTLQREGKYKVPAGVTDIPGLECSGVIDSVGLGVTKWKVGDESKYVKLEEFRKLAERFYPQGKLRNEFLDTHVFSPQETPVGNSKLKL